MPHSLLLLTCLNFLGFNIFERIALKISVLSSRFHLAPFIFEKLNVDIGLLFNCTQLHTQN